MSGLSEVKRWRMNATFLSECGLWTEVVLASDYEKLKAEYDAMEILLRRVIESKALKEAPFYNYCESIADAVEFLNAKRNQ